MASRVGIAFVAFCLLPAACNRRPAAAATIQNKGSDTMVNLAQVWAEEYRKVAPKVEVEVSGGGSGQGIASLIEGLIEVANCSRNMKPEEVAQARARTGREPKEFVAGYDAIAIYVHRDNPLEEIGYDELESIFSETGRVTLWSELGVKIPAGKDRIVRVSRQSSSGTYEYFREQVLHKRDMRLGSHDLNGSKEVVSLISSTPGAIGYSSIAYQEPGVKVLRVRLHGGQAAFPPTVANVVNKTYPLSRTLLLYTLGEPRGEVRRYIDWILSSAGQRSVAESGYVPLTAEVR